MLGTILQSLLGTVDLFFISKLGTNEAAAASLGASASGVVFVTSALISAGTIALVSRSYGEGNEESVKKISGESFLLSLLIGGLLSIICFLNTSSIIRIMFNTTADMTKLSSQYLKIIFAGIVLVYLNSSIRNTLHALGDTKTPLYIFGASNIINMILDPIFIFTFGLGLPGAAIATVTSMFLSYIAINWIMVKKIYNSSVKYFVSHIKLKLEDSLRILRIGIWDCIQQTARPITGMLMFRIVYLVGKEPGTAAFGIGGQLFNYTFIFLVGLSAAISIMVGQSLGRKDMEDVDNIIKEGLKLAAVNMVLFAIPYLLLSKYIISLFIKDLEVVKIGVDYLRIVYCGLVFVIFPNIYGGAFRGAGDTLPPMIASLVANIVVKLPIAYLLAVFLNLGTNGVWIAVALSVLVEAFIVTMYFRRGNWKVKEI